MATGAYAGILRDARKGALLRMTVFVERKPPSPEHVLQHAVAHHGRAVEFDGGAHHR
jgi:hypothetical protein